MKPKNLKTFRSFRITEQQRVATEFDPYVICANIGEGGGADDQRIVIGYTSLEDRLLKLIPWPTQQTITDCMTDFRDDSINALVRVHIRANIAAIRKGSYEGTDLRLDPFPRGDRIAIVGKGQTAKDWPSGGPLLIDAPYDKWTPNLTIYLNHAGARKRELAARSAQQWVAVIDRTVTMEEIAPAFDGSDGVILGIGVKPELFYEAARRGLPIHVICPHHYREAVADGLPMLGDVVTFTAFCGGVASTVLSALYHVRRNGTVLLTGVDGAYPFPAKDHPRREAEILRGFEYDDMAAVTVAMVSYLSSRGITWLDRSSLLDGELTPFGWANLAIKRWNATQTATRLAKQVDKQQIAKQALESLPQALKDAGVTVIPPEIEAGP